MIAISKLESILWKQWLKYQLLITGGGGTSQGGLSAADLL
jgi:hypothetical protein